MMSRDAACCDTELEECRNEAVDVVADFVPGRAAVGGVVAHFFVAVASVISSLRPRVTVSGGAGIVISRTPSLKLAFA